MNRHLSKLINALPTNQSKSVNRITLNVLLEKVLSRISVKSVLDVGAKHSPYVSFFKHRKYVRLDLLPDSQPDIVGDLHKLKIKDRTFDMVLATEVLEHLYDPQRAVNEMQRILTKNGLVVASTRFIYPFHPDPHDYYRFTRDSISYLFRNFSKVEIYTHGNRIQVIWQLLMSSGLGMFFNFLNPVVAKINFSDKGIYLGLVVVAKK
jgi:SAM-dependent methyltransferase